MTLLPLDLANLDKWKAIAVGHPVNPNLTMWCVYHPPGPPNTADHLTTGTRELAEKVVALLNWADHRDVPQRTHGCSECGRLTDCPPEKK